MGEPTWSSTTRSGSPVPARSRAAARIVFTKLWPVSLNSHAVRTTMPCTQASTSFSPASLVRP